MDTPERRAREDPGLPGGRASAQAAFMSIVNTVRTNPAHALRPASSAQILVAALLGFFLLSLDATAVNVALPGIGRTLGGTTAGLQWVVDAYTLLFASTAGALSLRGRGRLPGHAPGPFGPNKTRTGTGKHGDRLLIAELLRRVRRTRLTWTGVDQRGKTS